jgi:hypothetical protein
MALTKLVRLLLTKKGLNECCVRESVDDVNWKAVRPGACLALNHLAGYNPPA